MSILSWDSNFQQSVICSTIFFSAAFPQSLSRTITAMPCTVSACSIACPFDKSILRCEFLPTKWSNGPALLPEIKLSSFIRFTNYILSSEMPHMPTLDMFLHQKLPGSHLINLIELFARPSCCETPKSTFFLLLQYKTLHLTFSCLFYIEALTIWMGIFVEFSFVTSRFSYLSFEDEDLFEFQ